MVRFESGKKRTPEIQLKKKDEFNIEMRKHLNSNFVLKIKKGSRQKEDENLGRIRVLISHIFQFFGCFKDENLRRKDINT